MRHWKSLNPTAKHSSFARKLRAVMRDRRMSCGDVAVRLDVSLSAVWRWIAGDKLPSACHLEQLKTILEIDGLMIWEE